MSVPNQTAPNPSDIKQEKCDWEEHERRYPRQCNTNCRELKCKPRPKDGLLLKVGQCINDIPVEERHRYMWIVPDDLKDQPCYKEKDWGARMIRECEEKKCCEEKEKKKKQKDKDDSIELLLKHVSLLTEQVNELTKQMKK
jgi:hypothetical protein